MIRYEIGLLSQKTGVGYVHQRWVLLEDPVSICFNEIGCVNWGTSFFHEIIEMATGLATGLELLFSDFPRGAFEFENGHGGCRAGSSRLEASVCFRIRGMIKEMVIFGLILERQNWSSPYWVFRQNLDSSFIDAYDAADISGHTTRKVTFSNGIASAGNWDMSVETHSSCYCTPNACLFHLAGSLQSSYRGLPGNISWIIIILYVKY